MPTALFIGAHNEEIEAEIPLLPQLLSRAGWRVVILNPIGGWNWVEIRRMPEDMRGRLPRDCIDAAAELGAEKVLWDYDVARTPAIREELADRLAAFLRTVEPELVFIHWPYDGHQDHRLVAQVSLHVLRSVRNLIDDNEWQPTWREVWAFQVGIAQTFNFWPDILVVADQSAMDTARRALDRFVAYGEAKREAWWRNVLGKTSWWGALAGGRPAEAYKLVGPSFPAEGTFLKQALGDAVIAVSTELWTFGRGYIDVAP
ncbi:MAG: PIG-L family deacetylase [Armatimonadetes bacterium]|nr:PIG-L family deacetylase [Armatimonadota bacterium]